MRFGERVETLHHAKKILVRQNALPVYLIHFVTEVCNLRCKHCLDRFFEEGSGRKPFELSLGEIDRMTRSLGELLFLLPTGGEPFLRPDLPKIIELYYRNCRLRNVGMPTNGSLTDRIVQGVGEILARCPELHFGLDISIDGIGSDHDAIRGQEGLFEKCLETYWRLKDIEKRYANFKVCVEVTVQKYNQDKLGEIYDFFVSELKAYNVLVRVVRGQPREAAAKDVSLSRLEEFTSKLERGLRQGAHHGHAVYPMSDLITAREIIGRRIQLKLLRENRFQIPCYAANLIGVIRSNGDVMACELRGDKLGNIRDFDYDFPKLWLSEGAKAISNDIIANQCFCSHECFMSTNILFNPRLYPRLVSEVARLIWARFKRSRIWSPKRPGAPEAGIPDPSPPRSA